MFHILNLSAYTSPQINESKKGEFVEYGLDNNYFNFLIERYLYSTTNNAIITGVSNMIYGKGISALDANKKPDEYAKMISIIKPNCLKKIGLERKLLGMAAMQVGYEKGEVKFVDHFPMHTLRAEKCNDKGEIEAWYYHPDWANKKPSEEIKRIPAFGFGDGKEVELYIIKPYISGYHYYTPIDYSGALPYAKLEEEVSDYLINDVMNGFSGTKVINFNNGVPPEEKREEIANEVKRKLTGARGEKVIVGFNSSVENKTTVDDIPLNDAPAHYEYLSKECFEKLVVGHRVTSPMLLGIRDAGGGFSNNADEIKTATLLYDNLVIKPYQLEIIDALDIILAVNDIKLKLYFKTIQPLEFTDLTNAQTQDQVTEETGTQLSAHTCCLSEDNLDNEVANSLIELGETANAKWLLIDESEVDYDNDDAENEILSKEPKQSLLSKAYNFVSTGTARGNAKSEQDENIDGVRFITRYVYAGETSTKSRKFCQKMIDAGKIYRKEDIVAMSSKIVNEVRTNNEGEQKGFGPNGSPFVDVWLYKGGGACHHRWNKQVYASFEGVNIDVNSPKAKQIAGAKAEKYGYVIKNPNLVAQRPIDMPNKGFLPKTN
jgi:hypothetical protein